MKHFRRFVSAIALAFSLAAPAFAQEDSGVSGPVPTVKLARISVWVTDTDGDDYLAAIMARIQQLSEKDEFEDYLARDSRSVNYEQASCLEKQRPDKSGKTFDIARCLGVWPESSRAGPEKIFEAAFIDRVPSAGVLAFPRADVSTFEFPLRIKKTELTARERKAFKVVDDKGTPSDAFRKIMCDGKRFVAFEDCQVKIVERYRQYSDDVFVTQTGYRVTLPEAMPLEVAVSLRDELLKAAGKLGDAPRAVTVSITTLESTAKSDAMAGEAAPSNIKSHLVETTKMFAGIRSTPEDLDITNAATPPLASFFVFDKDVPNEVSFEQWLRATDPGIRAVAPDCAYGEDTGSHINKVANLLFPRRLLQVGRGENSDSIGITESAPSNFTGYFLREATFTSGGINVEPAGGVPWWSYGDATSPGHAKIALAVFHNGVQSRVEDYVKPIFDQFLDRTDTILVVSAPQTIELNTASPYSRDPDPKNDLNTFSDICKTRSFPSCLGAHPRVLVVAPSITDEAGGPPKLYGDYAMGASVIKLLAPGDRIPVIASCAPGPTSDATPFSFKTDKGSSFAAPQVALLIQKILEKGPDALGSNPEWAVWRVLATADPVSPEVEDGLVQYGQINVRRALTGINQEATGQLRPATVWSKDSKGALVPRSAVVMPYPWNDIPKNIDQGNSKSPPGAIFGSSRSALQIIEKSKATGTEDITGVKFTQIARIVRRPGKSPQGDLLFDVYYETQSVKTDLNFLYVARGVRMGSQVHSSSHPGYCTTSDMPGRAPNGEAEPSCLYSWDGTSGTSFEPLDLSKVEDIVFSPTHFDAQSPDKINYRNFSSIVSAGSPWKRAFCLAGPRSRTIVRIDGYKLEKLATACKGIE